MTTPARAFRFVAAIQVTCSFCGGNVQYGEADGRDAALHTEPPCREYVDLELLDFMIQNRRRLGIEDPEEN